MFPNTKLRCRRRCCKWILQELPHPEDQVGPDSNVGGGQVGGKVTQGLRPAETQDIQTQQLAYKAAAGDTAQQRLHRTRIRRLLLSAFHITCRLLTAATDCH